MSTNLSELGTFKNLVNPILYSSKDIQNILIGNSDKSQNETIKELKKHIFSHLYIDDVIDETGTYVFYDTSIPVIGNTAKVCKLIVYCLCHKDIIDTFTQNGYFGNRIDALCQMVEESFSNPTIIRKYGIGQLQLCNVSIFKNNKLYGKILEFEIPAFTKK